MYKQSFFNFFSVLSMFSSLYLTQVVPISPFYFGIGFSLILLIKFCYEEPTQKFFVINYGEDYIVIFFVFFLMLHILVNTVVNSIPLKYPLLTILSFLFFLFSFGVFQCSKDVLIKTFCYLKYVTTILLTIECIYRFTHPENLEWAKNTVNFFYMFKFSSIMFFDTNETGFFIEMIFIFFLYLSEKKLLPFSLGEKSIFFCFLCLSFSRAAVIGFCVAVCYWYFFRKLNFFVKCFIIFILLISVSSIIFFLSKDGSFLTKIDIFLKTKNYLLNASTRDLLLGIGLNNSITALDGIYGHNYISLFIIEFGLIGFFLFISFLFSLFLNCRDCAFILLAYFVTGLSFAPYFLPYFYLYLGIMYNLKKYNMLDY